MQYLYLACLQHFLHFQSHIHPPLSFTGAYGAAVLYRKKDDDSQVILKEINLLNLTKEERSSALNEVQVLKVLDHPHIISYYDNFEEEGVLMIEMEYADGG